MGTYLINSTKNIESLKNDLPSTKYNKPNKTNRHKSSTIFHCIT